MALDMFLVIEGEIKGESQDAVFKDKGGIDILAWSWGLSNQGSFHQGGGGGAGKASFQDLSLTKYIDKSSPVLMLYCSNGDHFPSAELTVRKAGKDPLPYLRIVLNKVLITSVSTGGSGGEDRLTENVSLNFAEAEVYYTPQLDTGEGDTEIPYKWDLRGNVKK